MKMEKKKDSSRPEKLDAEIRRELDAAFNQAEAYFVTKQKEKPPFAVENLSPRFIEALELMAKYCEKPLAVIAILLQAWR